MTVLPSVGDASGRGTPVEADDLHRCYRGSNLIKYSAEEIELYNKAKEFLGGDFDERILRELVKNFVSSRSPNSENILNELLSTYFDRLDSLRDRQIKQVRFDERLEAPSPTKYLSGITNRQIKTSDRASDVIDLSSEDEKKQWEITDNREEQDMAKAIEASLKENQSVLGISPYAQRDSENPYERLRLDLSPVGLKNIGNSCWFNTLFNIPAFRQMVFDYEFSSTASQSISCGDKPSSSNKSATPSSFVIALRRLFAFLMGSKRSYIDPTETINVVNYLATTLLKAVSCVGIQQDCTEMLLRFTEWFEKVFEASQVVNSKVKLLEHWTNVTTRPATSSINGGNVIPKTTDLVAGKSNVEDMDQSSKGDALNTQSIGSGKCQNLQSRSNVLDNRDVEESVVGRSAGDINCNNQCNPFTAMFHGSHVELLDNSAGLKNKFQLINLDISFGNLHDSFEAYHLSGFPSNEVCTLCFYSLWYETAPPVIVFSLVRFSYKNGQTEKIHSRFHFPCSFYLDRYLVKNREFVLENRVKKTNLTKKRLSLTKELDRLLKYSVGNSCESLPDTIDAVLKFIDDESKRCAEIDDVEPMEVGDELGTVESVCTSNNDQFAHNIPDLSTSTSYADPDRSSVSILEKNFGSEVTAVKTFLRTLSNDIQLKINALQTEVNTLNTEIETMFDVETMMEECYRLHSVIIHEGEANVGHYWAYVADYNKLDGNGMPVVWRKYNDKSVDLATYEQMEEDAYGSKRTCSAYCIVYTRKLSEKTLFGDEPYVKLSSVDEIVQSFPTDLRNEVSEDNAKFMEELRLWNSQQNVEVAGSSNDECILANIDKNEELKYLLIHDKNAGDDCEWNRYYENAYNSCGELVVKKTLEKLAKEVPDNVCGSDRMNKKSFEEMLSSTGETVKGIFDSKQCNSDRRIVLTEWARITGISLSSLASEIFYIRMFAVNRHLSFFCNERINFIAANDTAFIEAEKELIALLTLYNLYNEAIRVLAESTHCFWKYRGTRELNRDIGQAKLVNYTTRLFEIYRSYCREAEAPANNVEIDLLLIALMMISSVHVSQDFVEYLSDTTNDHVLVENKSFLFEDYIRLLYRLKNCGSQSTLAVRLKTVQYVMSLWEYLQRRLNSSHVSQIVEMLREDRSCDLRFTAPVEASFERNNLVQDLICIADFVSHTGLCEEKALQLLLKSSANGAKINSLQILPEDEVRKT
uniref:USP domain-containing protein n=1 Tax=Syphacia muris TaxID=451379 RepID=A0A158R546_9BILA